MRLRIRLLGGVELHAGERHSSVGTPLERLALAVLAWDAGRQVSVETLLRRIWDEEVPDRRRASLHTYLSHIRDRLRELVGHADQLVSCRNAYRLDIAREAVDAREYLALTERARVLAEAGDLRGALALLEDASGLWRGDPLPGLTGAWAEYVREELSEERLATATFQAGLLLRLGNFTEAAAGLRPLAARRPGDESLSVHLALALYAQGRVSDAERILQRTQYHLSRTFGQDPNAQLLRTQEGIFRRVPPPELLASHGLTASPGGEAAPAVVLAGAPDNLPPDVAWIGRAAEVERLLSAGAAAGEPAPGAPALATIDGMAGVGKTALAIHVAHRLRGRFPDGRLLLDLGANGPARHPLSPAEALTELLRLIGHPGEIPRDAERLTTLWRTVTRDRRVLVILDNATGPDQVGPLLLGSGPSFLLITSRHRLSGLGGVRPVSLAPLPEGDCVAMFKDRVGAERAPSDTDTAEIVRLCDFLPLAVDIMASRLLAHPSWSAGELLDRLRLGHPRIQEIRDPTRRFEGILGHGYQALGPVRQRVFRRLGLHLGSTFGPYTAAALADLPLDEAARAVEELHDFHLLTEPGPDRFSMHDLVASYARSLAEREGEESVREAMGRLVALCLHTADQADRQLHPQRLRISVDGPPPPLAAHWLAATGPRTWFVTEGPSLLALLDHSWLHGPPRTAALFSHTLAHFLDTEGYLVAATSHLGRAVDYWRWAGDGPALVRALLDLAAVRLRAGDYAEAERAVAEGLRPARAAGDAEAEAECLHRLGALHFHRGDNVRARAHAQEALRLRMRHSGRLQQARTGNLLASILLGLGNSKEASGLFQAALDGFRASGYMSGLLFAVNNLGELAKAAGDHEGAIRYYEKAMPIARDVGSAVFLATIRMNLAESLVPLGEGQAALLHYRHAVLAFRSAGDKRHEAIALNGVGSVLTGAGRPAEAAEFHRQALHLARHIHAANEEAQALRGLGSAALALGRRTEAEGHLRESLAIAEQAGAQGEIEAIGQVIAALGAGELASGDHE
ncbi:AfsR/SARP family transcriptional regulator [Streptomyces hoynatensis]|uniref:AfsR/SARP family transcriptional regulator n=1 Tax=Streptomyces hoynatensis TaxID=1141874 RepID=UPI0011C376A7|nr:tetratricopeptide repeat protein [Streptomyces hoynatensis]